jgi:P27 family predicted phage terminase small subunit
MKTKKKTARHTPPSTLDAEGKRAWRRLLQALRRNGNLDETDPDLIRCAAETHSEYQTARRELMRRGITLEETSPDGRKIQRANPFAEIISNAGDRLLNYYVALGLTPSARGQRSLQEFLKTRERGC